MQTMHYNRPYNKNLIRFWLFFHSILFIIINPKSFKFFIKKIVVEMY